MGNGKEVPEYLYSPLPSLPQVKSRLDRLLQQYECCKIKISDDIFGEINRDIEKAQLAACDKESAGLLMKARLKLNSVQKRLFGFGFQEAVAAQLVCRINEARQNPSQLASKIRKQAQGFQAGSKVVQIAGRVFETEQGAAAWEQAATFLQQVKPTAGLQPKEQLCLYCYERIRDIYYDRQSAKRPLEQRLSRYVISSGEAIQLFADGTSTDDQFLNFVAVSDGFPQRGQRHGLYSRKAKFVGAYSARGMRLVCLVEAICE